MTPADIQRARSLFLACAELAEPDRAAFLAQRCRDDTGLRTQVERLLASDRPETFGGAVRLVAPGGALDDGLAEPKYEVHEELGSGPLGTVYRGRDVRLGRDVALKFLRVGSPDDPDDPDRLRRFVIEARNAGRLQHPGIVPLYELGVEGAQPFFTMKLVAGDNWAWLSTAAPPTREQRSVQLARFHAVCLAIAYAHDRGVVHGNLTLHSVRIGAFGEIQVVGWEPAGADAGAHADVFALGAMLCDVLTGVPPSPAAALASGTPVGSDAVVARLAAAGIDATLVQLARECLAADPHARPRDAGAVAARVGSYLIEAEQRAQDTRLAEHTARQRLRWSTAAIVTVLLGVATSLWFWSAAVDARGRLLRSNATLVVADLIERVAVDRELYRDGADDERRRWLDDANDVLAWVPDVVHSAPDDPAVQRAGELLPIVARHVDALANYRHRWQACRQALAADQGMAQLLVADRIAADGDDCLLPLGRDADSGRFEFYVGGTGTVPAWQGDPRAGRVAFAADDGIVLVLVPRGFLVGKFELTRTQWQRLLGGKPAVEGRLPQADVSWADSNTTLARWQLALPTAQQWDYACRADRAPRYGIGDAAAALRSVAWCAANAAGHAHPVGQLLANAFGLHDMHGNLWEWLSYRRPRERVLVGGGFNRDAGPGVVLHANFPSLASDYIGVRPVRSIRLRPHAAMTAIGDTLYLIERGSLFAIAAQPPGRRLLGRPGAWAGTTAMTALGDRLCVADTRSLYLVDPATGAPSPLPGDDAWVDTPVVAALGAQLHAVKHDTIYAVDRESGAATMIGDEYVREQCTAGTALGDRLYLAHSHGVHRIDPASGASERVGPLDDWAEIAVMTGLGDALYLVQDGSLYRLDPATGERVPLGPPRQWPRADAMAACGARLWVLDGDTLYDVDPTNGARRRRD